MLVPVQRAAGLPITLPETKQALRVAFDDDDQVIENLIRSEIRRYEDFTRRVILQTEFKAFFPRWQSRFCIEISPLRVVTAVSYFAEDEAWHDLPSGSWSVSPSCLGGIVLRISDSVVLPALGDSDYPVAVQLQAGADLPGDDPAVVLLDHADRMNILHLVKQVFDHDEPMDESAMIARMGGRRLMW